MMKRSLLFLTGISMFMMSEISVAQDNPLFAMDHEANDRVKLSYGIALTVPDSLDNAQVLKETITKKLSQKDIDVQFLHPNETKFADVVINISDDGTILINNQKIQAKDGGLDAAIVSWFESEYAQGIKPQTVPVFENVKDGYVSFRIPSLVALPNNKLLAFIEARSAHKDTACNDIVMKSSTDGGKTWSAPKVVQEEGKYSLNNITVGYVPQTDEIVMIYQSYPPKTSEGTKFKGENNRQKVLLTTSSDRGETWSKPHEITDQVFHPKANTVCSGPGVMIQATSGPDKGRLIVPFNALGGNTWYNYLVYSDDFGKTWKIADGESQYGTNESQIVQVGDHEFLICARSHRNQNCDKAETPKGWGPWNFNVVTRNRAYIPVSLEGNQVQWGTTEVRADLPDANCQGSITRVGKYGDGKKSRLLVSNPASQYTLKDDRKRSFGQVPTSRVNGTVRVSYDEGKTWTYSKRIHGDRLSHFGYSVLADMGNGRIGCLYESGPRVLFTSFDLKWLSSGKDDQ